MHEYMSVREAAEKWGISERRVQVLCRENRIDNIIRFGKSWAIPKDTPKPLDARFKENHLKNGRLNSD